MGFSIGNNGYINAYSRPNNTQNTSNGMVNLADTRLGMTPISTADLTSDAMLQAYPNTQGLAAAAGVNDTMSKAFGSEGGNKIGLDNPSNQAALAGLPASMQGDIAKLIQSDAQKKRQKMQQMQAQQGGGDGAAGNVAAATGGEEQGDGTMKTVGTVAGTAIAGPIGGIIGGALGGLFG